MVEQEEKKNKRIAAFTTVVLNALLLTLLLFVVAWRAPNPPLPEYGIELNFGVDTQGGGDLQPTEPVGSNEAIEDPEVEESQQEEATPVESESTEPTVVNKQESPVTVKEAKEPPKEPVKEVKKEEKKNEPVKTVEKPKEVAQTVYTPKTSTDKNAADKAGQAESQGDDKEKGDKGNPEGSVDANSLYGKKGGGDGGPSLDLAGWKWESVPKPTLADNVQSGRIVFKIKVNQYGEITSIIIDENSVGPEAARICRAEIEKLTFSKTGTNVPEESIGKITFVVRSK
jgi:protein TonB